MTVVGILDKTAFSETERQIVLMTDTRLNGCGHCMAAHSTISQSPECCRFTLTNLLQCGQSSL